MFSVANLTDVEADLIADAYFKSGKNHARMAEILEIEYFDLNLLGHPAVKNRILSIAQMQAKKYSLDQHLDKLKEIRDLCMSERAPQYKVALAAEIALGKAAGLYDLRRGDENPENEIDPEKLSTTEIRALLVKRGVVSVDRLPPPQEEGPDLREDSLS